MKTSLKKKIIILLLVILSIIVIFLYQNAKEDYNITIFKAKEQKESQLGNSTTYTIVFDLKGGTNGPDSIQVTTEANRMPDKKPTKPGYEFVGWATISEPSSIWCIAGGNYNLSTLSEADVNANGTITLLAIWQRKIMFDSKGGNFNLSYTLVNDEGNNIMPSEIPTKSGCEFLGWATISDPNSVWCVAGGNYNLNRLSQADVNADGTITLLAVWQRKLMFDLKGGKYNLSYTLANEEGENMMPSEKPTKPGCEFVGWATISDPNSVWCVAGGKYNLNKLSQADINTDGTITLLAIWQDAMPPTIEIKTNENTTWSKTANVTVTIKDNDSGLAEGIKIKYGWSTSKDREPEHYTQATINYKRGTTENVNFTAVASGLTGKYYLWIVPETLKDIAGNSNTKIVKSTGTFYLRENLDETNSDKDDTNQGNTNQGNTNQGNTNQGNTNQGNTNQGNTNQGNTNQGNTNQGNTNQGNTNQGNTNQGNTNQGNTNQGNTNQGNTNQDNTNQSNSYKTNTAQTNSYNANTSQTNLGKVNANQTISNKDNTNRNNVLNKNEATTATMPLAYAGLKLNIEKVIMISILVCSMIAIILYFKFKKANY